MVSVPENWGSLKIALKTLWQRCFSTRQAAASVVSINFCSFVTDANDTCQLKTPGPISAEYRIVIYIYIHHNYNTARNYAKLTTIFQQNTWFLSDDDKFILPNHGWF